MLLAATWLIVRSFSYGLNPLGHLREHHPTVRRWVLASEQNSSSRPSKFMDNDVREVIVMLTTASRIRH